MKKTVCLCLVSAALAALAMNWLGGTAVVGRVQAQQVTPVRTVDEFLNLIEQHRPGDRVELTIVRNNRPLRVPLVLGANE